jgi:SAM-dependent methyltransferase
MIKTDWDAYYTKTAPTAYFTRRITAGRLLSAMRELTAGKIGISICEIGGANSCFAGTLLADLPVDQYHVIDNNAFGLELLRKRFGDAGKVSWQHCDVLGASVPIKQFDIVFSVGLIEHFDPAGTSRSVASHFRLVKPGGGVIITFPTPTWLYRITRGAIEAVDQWQFPDERPLEFVEVEKAISTHGTVISRQTNWSIILTQGIIVARPLV